MPTDPSPPCAGTHRQDLTPCALNNPSRPWLLRLAQATAAFAAAGAADIAYRTRLDAPFGQLTLDVFKLFNRPVNDIQYFHASQPAGLPASEGRHVHPAEPRSARLSLRVGF